MYVGGKNKLIDTEDRLVVAKVGEKRVGNMDEEVKRYKLPVIK